MHVIRARNVHQAIPEAMRYMRLHGCPENSRNGQVLRAPGPVTTAYEEPRERVEFHPTRDSNPFFHFMESLWMLAGRRDVAWVQQFNSNIGRYSDDGETFHGAYGHRWRYHFKQDQLLAAISELVRNPESRRVVVQMWDARSDLGREGKDLPCNTNIYFARSTGGALDMTVCNRSNDIVWGCYGANAVHMSFLHEFMAVACRMPVGTYYQVSNNWHLYVEPHLILMNQLADEAPDPPSKRPCPYEAGTVSPGRLVTIAWDRWLDDLQMFVDHDGTMGTADPFFRRDAIPMIRAWKVFKTDSPNRHDEAIQICSGIQSSDWRLACTQWIERRRK